MTTHIIALASLHAASTILAAFAVRSALRYNWMPAIFLILVAIWAQP